MKPGEFIPKILYRGAYTSSNKLMTFEKRCYRRILNVRWQQKSQTNKLEKEWVARETENQGKEIKLIWAHL